MIRVRIRAGMQLDWPEIKAHVEAKRLLGQFEEDDTRYFIFAVDGSIVYYANIWKLGNEPDGWSQQDIDDNELYLDDFVDNYKDDFNRQVS